MNTLFTLKLIFISVFRTTSFMLFQLLISTSANAVNEIPEKVYVSGEFRFSMITLDGKSMWESEIDSDFDIESVGRCRLEIIAYDDFYNSFPAEINHMLSNDGVLITTFQIKSVYTDEESRTRTKRISEIALDVSGQSIDDSKWLPTYVRAQNVLVSPTVEDGQLLLHQLSLGQPLGIQFSKDERPMDVAITVAPLKSNASLLLRKCMERVSLLEKKILHYNKSESTQVVQDNPQVIGDKLKPFIVEALELYQYDNFSLAIQLLLKAEPNTEYESAYVNRFIANLYAMDESGYRKAIPYLVKATSPKILKDKEHAQSLKLLADLSLATEKFESAVNNYQRWIDFTGNSDEVVIDRMEQARQGLKPKGKN